MTTRPDLPALTSLRFFAVKLPRSANFWGCFGLMLATSFLMYFLLERPMRKAFVRRFAS